MFDNISFQIENYSQSDFKSLLKNWVLAEPKDRGNWLQVDWHNLRINYFPRQLILKASNSLHKFFNAEITGIGEVNHNDFTFSQVVETVRYLEDAFNRTCNEIKLFGKLEYGLNINTGQIKPFEIIDRYQSMVTTTTNPFYIFNNPYGKPYSKFCPFTHYSIKCYDKGKQMGLSGVNIMRYEVVHNSSTQTKIIFGKTDITLRDLTKLSIWKKCNEFIQKSYLSIRFLAFPTDGIEMYTKTLCYSLAIVNKDFKSALTNKIKQLKEAHNALRQKSDSPHYIITSGLINGFKLLLDE